MPRDDEKLGEFYNEILENRIPTHNLDEISVYDRIEEDHVLDLDCSYNDMPKIIKVNIIHIL